MPRRGENIRKRKDGRWEARVKQQDGKLQSVYAKSYNDLKEKLENTTVPKEETTDIHQRPIDIKETPFSNKFVKIDEKSPSLVREREAVKVSRFLKKFFKKQKFVKSAQQNSQYHDFKKWA